MKKFLLLPKMIKKPVKLTVLRILVGYFLISSLLLTFIIPPFQKTDEVSHFYKTIAVANGNFFCRQEAGGQDYNYLPQAYANLPVVLMSDFTNESVNNRFPIAAFKQALKLGDKNSQSQVKETISCSLPFLLYLPVALVLWIPIHSHFLPLIVFYLGRMSFLFLAWALIALAYKIISPKYRLLLIGYLIVPMVGIDLGSFNKEVLHLSAGALIFASYFKLREKFSKKYLFILISSLFMVVLSRPFYAPLFVLIPLILPKKSYKYLLVLALTLISIFLLYLPKLLHFHNGVINSSGVSAVLQMAYLGQHPGHFLSVLLSSYNNHMTAYAKSLIGAYGSIHYYLDWYIYIFFGAWLLFLVLKYRDDLPKFNTKEIMALCLSILAIILSSFFLFYLYATPVAYHYVIDVQGRYFINLLPFIILLLATLIKKYPQPTLMLCFSLVIFFFLKNTYDRYFNYSAGYVYEDAEKLAALSQDSQLIGFEIDQPMTKIINIDASKKLTGVSFIVVNPDNRITNPVQIEFLAEDCEQLIYRTMLMNHTKKTTSSIDIPIKLANQAKLCVKVSPFSTQAVNAVNEKLAIDPDYEETTFFTMPFYAY
jgi:uncharacterized membrane protein